MEGLVGIAVLIYVAFAVLAVNKKVKKSDGRTESLFAKAENPFADAAKMMKEQKKTPRVVRIEKDSSKPFPERQIQLQQKQSAKDLAANLEDRKHDWLARQLAEERAIQRRGSELDLGAGHRDNCDARSLKIQHMKEHGRM